MRVSLVRPLLSSFVLSLSTSYAKESCGAEWQPPTGPGGLRSGRGMGARASCAASWTRPTSPWPWWGTRSSGVCSRPATRPPLRRRDTAPGSLLFPYVSVQTQIHPEPESGAVHYSVMVGACREWRRQGAERGRSVSPGGVRTPVVGRFSYLRISF